MSLLTLPQLQAVSIGFQISSTDFSYNIILPDMFGTWLMLQCRKNFPHVSWYSRKTWKGWEDFWKLLQGLELCHDNLIRIEPLNAFLELERKQVDNDLKLKREFWICSKKVFRARSSFSFLVLTLLTINFKRLVMTLLHALRIHYIRHFDI